MGDGDGGSTGRSPGRRTRRQCRRQGPPGAAAGHRHPGCREGRIDHRGADAGSRTVGGEGPLGQATAPPAAVGRCRHPAQVRRLGPASSGVLQDQRDRRGAPATEDGRRAVAGVGGGPGSLDGDTGADRRRIHLPHRRLGPTLRTRHPEGLATRLGQTLAPGLLVPRTGRDPERTGLHRRPHEEPRRVRPGRCVRPAPLRPLLQWQPIGRRDRFLGSLRGGAEPLPDRRGSPSGPRLLAGGRLGVALRGAPRLPLGRRRPGGRLQRDGGIPPGIPTGTTETRAVGTEAVASA